jgi:TRAP-type uncharacterized transport system substrate-binding protein
MRFGLGFLLVALTAGLIVFFTNGLKPPDQIRMAAGIQDGGYWRIAEYYQAKLAQDGVYVELVETAGSIENIDKVTSGHVDVALVQGGLDISQQIGLQSLGGVFLEPIVIFRSSSNQLDNNPGNWRDIRLAAGPEGSGTRAATQALISAAGLQNAGIELLEFGGDEAVNAVRNGDADAMLFVAPLAAPYLMEAIFDPKLIFVPLSFVDALASKLSGASAVTIPAGAIALSPPRPPEAVKILALRASLIASTNLHPALVDRFVKAATELHGDRDILHGYREYPSVTSPPVPMSATVQELIISGPSFLHDFLPYWIAAQFGRVLLVVLPLLLIALPILRAIPSAYVWFQNRRIWNHYQRIAVLELELSNASTREEVNAVKKQLDELDTDLANLNLPLAYRQGAYDVRLHVDLIRQEILRRSD